MRLRLAASADMHDQRVEARALLRREDRRDRCLVERVRAEPVDRLGRERDEPALAQQPGRFGDGALTGGLDARRSLRRNLETSS